MTDLRGRSSADVLEFYRDLVEPTPGYVGYSEQTLKCGIFEVVNNLPGRTIVIETASVHQTPFGDEVFDIAILSETLEHVPDDIEVAALTEAHRIVKRGGHLVVSVPNASRFFTGCQSFRIGVHGDQHPQHLRECTPAIVQRLLTDAGFEIVRASRVPATSDPPWRSRAAWIIDRVAALPRWSLKVTFVARKPE